MRPLRRADAEDSKRCNSETEKARAAGQGRRWRWRCWPWRSPAVRPGPAATSQSVTGSTGGSLTGRLAGLFSSSGSAPAQATTGRSPADDQADVRCPVVDIRNGTSTITTYGPGEAAATNVRYQATIGETARECALRGATFSMKVGVEGRVIVGPLGAPPKVDVPLRIALVREGPTPKTLFSKLYRIPVTMPAGDANVPFIHVDEDIAIPKPSGDDLENMIVYVGFDQSPVKEPAAKRTRRKR